MDSVLIRQPSQPEIDDEKERAATVTRKILH